MSEASYTEEQLFELFGTTPTSMRWHKIETAPRDGTNILIATTGMAIREGVGKYEYVPPLVCEAFWQNGWYNEKVSGWQLANCDEEYGCLMEATHWMPLPPSPTPEPNQ